MLVEWRTLAQSQLVFCSACWDQINWPQILHSQILVETLLRDIDCTLKGGVDSQTKTFLELSAP